MNSQLVEITNVLRSKFAFIFLASLIPVALFFKAGFVSVSVMWFFALCLYSARSSELNQLRFDSLLLLPILLLFLHLLGLLYSEKTDVGFALVLRKVHLLVLPVGFLLMGKRLAVRDVYNRTLQLFMLSTFVASFVCLANAVIDVVSCHSFGFKQGEVYYYYFLSHLLTRPLNLDPVYLSLFCNFALLVALNSTLIVNMIYKATAAIYFALVITLCSSNGGIVSAMVIVALWLIGISQKKLVFYGLSAAVATTILLFSLNRSFLEEAVLGSFKFTYSTDTGQLSSYSPNKLLIWQCAIEAVMNSPIIGYGTGDGQTALESQFAEEGLAVERRDELNAHNEFLSTTLDLGFVGLLCLLLMLIVPFIHALRAKDLLAVGFVLMITIFFSIESVLLRQKGIVFFSFFYSVLFFRLSEPRPEPMREGWVVYRGLRP